MLIPSVLLYRAGERAKRQTAMKRAYLAAMSGDFHAADQAIAIALLAFAATPSTL